MPPPSSRMTKNRAQPTRYRPGKAEVDDAQSDEESSEEEDDDDDAPVKAKAPPPKATSFPSQKKFAVDLSKAGHQTAPPAKKAGEEELDGFVTASETSSDEEDESGSGDDDAEEESEDEDSSSDEEPKKPILAPKFISKAKRAAQQPASTQENPSEPAQTKQEKADALLQSHLTRTAQARAAGQKFWDDDDIAPEDDVDDTDGLDVEAERAAWKLRELKRVRRERVAVEEKEKEKEEVERRRNLTAEEREEEDRAFIDAQRDDREGRGKMGFMQKYFHKGAFFGEGGEEADEEVKAALQRDFAGRKFEDDAGDKAVLPEYMRMRDMTKLGKKGRTKYKDLREEDTGRWGSDVGRRKREFDGVDERFRPDEQRDGGRERTGANEVAVGERRRREDGGGREEKRARYE